MKKKETKLQELERRIKVLEDRATTLPPNYPQDPNWFTIHHFHGSQPCFNNPCV
jgi:hypothetical protein